MRSFREHIIYSWNGLWYLQSVATDDIIIISKHPFISPRLFDNAFGQSIESAFQPSMRWLDFFFFIFISQYSDACGYVRVRIFLFLFFSVSHVMGEYFYFILFLFPSMRVRGRVWVRVGVCTGVCVYSYMQASIHAIHVYVPSCLQPDNFLKKFQLIC